jgi:hypothetical protein
MVVGTTVDSLGLIVPSLNLIDESALNDSLHRN